MGKKIALGSLIQSGPWGGGNEFAKSLCASLRHAGWEIIFDLNANDIDVILITDPRGWSPSVAFSLRQVLFYKLFVNYNCVVVHRINECDERKKTYFMNLLLRCANSIANHSVFISNWLTTLNVSIMPESMTSVIMNGADKTKYRAIPHKLNDDAKVEMQDGYKTKIVTHHWSNHLNKGFEVYRFIDSCLADPMYNSIYEFTFIGNIPVGTELPNSRVLQPMYGYELSSELAKHDIYVTASINEPAGMHHIEASCSGLPVLYRKNGGGICEYCKDFGVEYVGIEDFWEKLERVRIDIGSWKLRVQSYPYSSELMCNKYIALFEDLIQAGMYKWKGVNFFKRIFYFFLVLVIPK